MLGSERKSSTEAQLSLSDARVRIPMSGGDSLTSPSLVACYRTRSGASATPSRSVDRMTSSQEILMSVVKSEARTRMKRWLVSGLPIVFALSSATPTLAEFLPLRDGIYRQ